MKSGTLLLALLFSVGVCLHGGRVMGEDKKPTPPPAPKAEDKKPAEAKPAEAKPAEAPKKDAAPGGAPGADEMMKMMAQMSAPGPEHAALKPLSGSFKCTTKMMMDPTQPPTESTGTMERKWIMGDRFMVEEFSGPFMGMPFQGMGIIGYDKALKKYFFTWIDNFGTGAMHGLGVADASGKTFTYEALYNDPMTGTATKQKHVTKIINNDKQTFEMFDLTPDGKERKTMEMECTRGK